MLGTHRAVGDGQWTGDCWGPTDTMKDAIGDRQGGDHAERTFAAYFAFGSVNDHAKPVCLQSTTEISELDNPPEQDGTQSPSQKFLCSFNCILLLHAWRCV